MIPRYKKISEYQIIKFADTCGNKAEFYDFLSDDILINDCKIDFYQYHISPCLTAAVCFKDNDYSKSELLIKQNNEDFVIINDDVGYCSDLFIFNGDIYIVYPRSLAKFSPDNNQMETILEMHDYFSYENPVHAVVNSVLYVHLGGRLWKLNDNQTWTELSQFRIGEGNCIVCGDQIIFSSSLSSLNNKKCLMIFDTKNLDLQLLKPQFEFNNPLPLCVFNNKIVITDYSDNTALEFLNVFTKESEINLLQKELIIFATLVGKKLVTSDCFSTLKIFDNLT